MKKDREPLIFHSTVDSEPQEGKKNTSVWWERSKNWAFLILTVVVGLFDVVTDWQNFIKYVSKPEDLREFVLTVAVCYFLFCCFIGTSVYFWDVWLAYREFKGQFDEEILSRDLELRDDVYKEKMLLSLVTILLEDFPCFLLNFFMVYCDSPENIEEPMFHLASWQTLALISSLVSVVISFARLLWLNYRYCKIFGCVPKGSMLSSCCVWTNSVLAYLALAAMLYFFFGQFVPETMSFFARQAKLSQERNYKAIPVTKAITFEIHDVYHYAATKDRKEFEPREVKESLFDGIYSNVLKTMENEGVWLKQNKRCSDIFYHVKPRILMNHVWNPPKRKYIVSTTEYYWQWKGNNCSAIKSSSGKVLTSSCQPLWFEIEPVWCNFTYRIVYDQNKFMTFYNVANSTEEACTPVQKKWIITVLNEDGTAEKRLSYCEKAARKWKPVWQPDIPVCYSLSRHSKLYEDYGLF